MAIETYVSVQLGSDRLYPIEDHGKLRFKWFNVVPTVIGTVLSTANLVKLPYGRIRLMPNFSRVWFGAFGAARVLDIGHRAYNAQPSEATPAIVEALAAIAVGIDVSAAGNAQIGATTLSKFDFFSTGGVIITAQCRVDTWPVAGTLTGYIGYLHE